MTKSMFWIWQKTLILNCFEYSIILCVWIELHICYVLFFLLNNVFELCVLWQGQETGSSCSIWIGMEFTCLLIAFSAITILGFVFVVFFEAYKRRNNHQYVLFYTILICALKFICVCGLGLLVWYFLFFFFKRHIEVPAIFEDPSSLKQVNVSLCIVIELLQICKIL